MQSSSPDKDSRDSDQDCGSDSESEDDASGAHPSHITAWDSGSTLLGHHPNHNAHALPDPDPMVRRLQDQEEELRQHILHSPQPLRFIRPAVTASYETPPSWNPYASHFMNGAPVGYPYKPYAHDSFPPYSQSPQENQHEQVAPIHKSLIAGYEHLASKLSEDYVASSNHSIRPLYRRFEQLNHRILLHLQDEISELEEELRQLDQAIAQMNLDSQKTPGGPQSRRHEAQFGNEMHHRRTELLGKVFVKLGQYNKAIKGYRNAFPEGRVGDPSSQTFGRPLKFEIDRYRAWMEWNAPIDASEAKFLQHQGDLVALPKLAVPPEPTGILRIVIMSTAISTMFTTCLLKVNSVGAAIGAPLLVIALVASIRTYLDIRSKEGPETKEKYSKLSFEMYVSVRKIESDDAHRSLALPR